MQNTIPNFTYNPAGSSNGYIARIEMDGNEIHEIRNPDEFYEEFGFTADTRKSGMVAEEFIWEEYTSNATISAAGCMKIRIIEYLIKYSKSFREEYGVQCGYWLADHAGETLSNSIACIACRMKPLCDVENK